MKVLGIETSCDETAAAVVEDGRRLLSNVVASSVDLHTAYGGVVPEIAARSHLESILPVIDKTLKNAFEANSSKPISNSPDNTLSANSYQLTARTMAITKKTLLYGINHVEAHVYAAFLEEKQPGFPLLALVVSGVHTLLVLFKNNLDYSLLGETKDDAVGEAFDKVAKILGLPYPGGPSVAEAAKNGDPTSVKLPKAKLGSSHDFSFSGLKTAVLRKAQKMAGKDYTFPSHKLPKVLSASQKADLAASFQRTAAETLVDALVAATDELKPKSVVIAGGVAANQYLRKLASERVCPTPIYPDIKLCTDNAAMIAALGYYKATNGVKPDDPHKLAADPALSLT